MNDQEIVDNMIKQSKIRLSHTKRDKSAAKALFSKSIQDIKRINHEIELLELFRKRV